MSEAGDNPLEMIMRQCSASAPEPWYPSQYVRANGISRDQLDPHLDELRMGGLIRLTDWVQGLGQGYTLTPEGTVVLQSPRELSRLRSGQVQAPVVRDLPVVPPHPLDDSAWARGEVVRRAILEPSTPVVSNALIGINIIVFIAGLTIAVRGHIPAREYLSGDPTVRPVLLMIGAVSGLNLMNHEWWRLLSSCFVHIGLLHMGLNMYSVYALGRIQESMWGPVRYLILYLLSGFSGSCAMMIMTPESWGAGASGAVFGLMSSLAVWIFLNRDYIGPAASAMLRRLLIVFVLNMGISALPGISASAHAGGALAGLVIALLLHVHRFNRGIPRLVAGACILAWPLLSFAALLESTRLSPHWRTVRERYDLIQWVTNRLPQVEQLRREAAILARIELPALRKAADKQPGEENDNKVLAAREQTCDKLLAALRIVLDAAPLAEKQYEAERAALQQNILMSIAEQAGEAEQHGRQVYQKSKALLQLGLADEQGSARLRNASAELALATRVLQQMQPLIDSKRETVRQNQIELLRTESALAGLAAEKARLGPAWNDDQEKQYKEQVHRVRELREASK